MFRHFGGEAAAGDRVRSGWLLAGAADPGWTDRLLPHQRHVLASAFLGLYKSSGIEVVREQIESLFATPAPWYDLSAQGLVLWPGETWEAEVLYDLHEGPWIAPQSIRGPAWQSLPTLERWRLVFGDVPIAWEQWVLAWNQDLAGQCLPSDSIAPVKVLPAAKPFA